MSNQAKAKQRAKQKRKENKMHRAASNRTLAYVRANWAIVNFKFDPVLFWSTEFGWTTIHCATLYQTHEKDAVDMPQHGDWINYDAYKEDMEDASDQI